jgi:hypothetical protein
VSRHPDDACCDGTGFADYAAVPCPNPTCRAQGRKLMEQPDPIPNDRTPIADLVVADVVARKEHGTRTYGTPLQPFNGRDALRDAYEEALDLVVYLRQVIEERDAAQHDGSPIEEWYVK